MSERRTGRIRMETDFTEDIDDYISRFKEVLDRIDRGKVNRIANMLLDAYKEGKQVFVFGNGGSASTASHFACDFNKGVCFELEKKFMVICLNDNIPTLLALANDVGYGHVFAEQLKNYLQEGDLVIGISGSGNSENVLNAIEYAKGRKAHTIGVSGFHGGRLKSLAETSLVVEVEDMQKVEDAHLMLVHLLMQALSRRMKSKKTASGGH